MPEEENIKQQLIEKFTALGDKVTIARPRRIFADVPLCDFDAVFKHLVTQMRFSILVTITGLDEGPVLGFIYHLAREDGTVLNLHTTAPKDNAVIKSVTGFFPVADAYERELVDLFGAKVTGLAPGERYPLPDGWPENQFPLRKDWKPDTLEKKGGE